jgi:predicted ATPase/DNA-binding XRE family transcriptional regulator
MKTGAPSSFGAHLKSLREAAGFTQEELATIAGLSVHAVSALERGERKRPHVETVRALSAALDLAGAARDALLGSARAHHAAIDELSPTALPASLTTLLGREGDVQILGPWLADPSARLITLLGPGGVGKTRLAVELARMVAADGTTRVVFLGLAAVEHATFVAPAIAEALGLSDVTAVDLPRRVRAACDGRPTLLVLDNCEHVLDAAPLVADLLAAAPSLRLLATSRAPLRIRGEREYSVNPLALESDVEGLSPPDLARAPAVRLFVERVRDVQPDFCLTAANGPTVTAICRRLDALPLALELAAPWIKVLTPEDLLHRIEGDVLLPTVGPRDLPERQQTMNETVAWSYRLLDPDEQRAFRRLSALPGRFPIDAAAAVLAGGDPSASPTGDAISAVARLIDKSLILRTESSTSMRPLYQMLETVRAYGSLELSASGERDDALEGLVRYCLNETQLAADGLVGPAQAEWLDRTRDNLECYRGAMNRLIEHRRAAEASGIAWELLIFWVIRGHAAEGLRWYEQVLSLAPLPADIESRALNGSALLLYTQGELDRARIAINGALVRAREAADIDLVARAENIFGHIEHAVGNMTAARDLFESGLRGFRACAIAWGEGNALSGLAWVALATNDGAEAERLLDEATLVLRDGGPWFRELGLYLRAVLAVRRQRPDEAIEFIRESLLSIRTLHDKFAFVYALVPLAAAAALKGDAAWAARILGAQFAVTERTGATVVDNSVNDLRQKTEQDARVRLGPGRWERAYAAGRSASIDSLLKDIESAQR